MSNPIYEHYKKEGCSHTVVENGYCRLCNCKVEEVPNVCGRTGLYRKVKKQEG